MPTILCVEDEVDLRNDLVEELRDAGYETIEASNGAEGLGKLALMCPDLVICDITMPVMNGIQLLQEIRDGFPALADIPFIFLSALEDIKGMSTAEYQANEYLTKPVDYESILAIVRRYVGASEDVSAETHRL